MSKRKFEFITGETYHVFNRGVDKRNIFSTGKDSNRFLESMKEFKTVEPIGSLYLNNYRKKRLQLRGKASQLEVPNALVEIIAYCLNPNHYHFLLEQVSERGIEKFMHKMGTGYTRYFNDKYDRNGSLFQSKFKASYVSFDDRLPYISAYVNLNDKVHQLRGKASQLVRSSMGEYVGGIDGVPEVSIDDSICDKSMIMEHFKSKRDYKRFAEKTVKEVIKQRKEDKELDKLLID
jgi:putative transposase